MQQQQQCKYNDDGQESCANIVFYKCGICGNSLMSRDPETKTKTERPAAIEDHQTDFDVPITIRKTRRIIKHDNKYVAYKVCKIDRGSMIHCRSC